MNKWTAAFFSVYSANISFEKNMSSVRANKHLELQNNIRKKHSTCPCENDVHGLEIAVETLLRQVLKQKTVV